MTDLEKKVYTALMNICNEDFSADMDQLVESTKLSMETIRGVVGSLVKKELAHSETGDRKGMVDIFAIDSEGFVISYGEQS